MQVYLHLKSLSSLEISGLNNLDRLDCCLCICIVGAVLYSAMVQMSHRTNQIRVIDVPGQCSETDTRKANFSTVKAILYLLMAMIIIPQLSKD